MVFLFSVMKVKDIMYECVFICEAPWFCFVFHKIYVKEGHYQFGMNGFLGISQSFYRGIYPTLDYL